MSQDAFSESENCTALMTAMRQLGVGSQGGAEALAIFNQLLYNEWASGSLDTPLARISSVLCGARRSSTDAQ